MNFQGTQFNPKHTFGDMILNPCPSFSILPTWSTVLMAGAPFWTTPCTALARKLPVFVPQWLGALLHRPNLDTN